MTQLFTAEDYKKIFENFERSEWFFKEFTRRIEEEEDTRLFIVDILMAYCCLCHGYGMTTEMRDYVFELNKDKFEQILKARK